MSLDYVTTGADVVRTHFPDRITDRLFLFGRELLVGELLGDLRVFAAGAVARLARRPLQVRRGRGGLEARRPAKACRMTTQTLRICLVLRWKQVERLCVLGDFPLH